VLDSLIREATSAGAVGRNAGRDLCHSWRGDLQKVAAGETGSRWRIVDAGTLTATAGRQAHRAVCVVPNTASKLSSTWRPVPLPPRKQNSGAPDNAKWIGWSSYTSSGQCLSASYRIVRVPGRRAVCQRSRRPGANATSGTC